MLANMFIALLSTFMCVQAQVPNLLLASTVEDKVIFEAMGTYIPDGEAFNTVRYRLDSNMISRFLYRAKKGQWTITGNEANIAASKGTIVSTSATATTPVGASFKYYFEKKWKDAGKTLTVSELPSEQVDPPSELLGEEIESSTEAAEVEVEVQSGPAATTSAAGDALIVEQPASQETNQIADGAAGAPVLEEDEEVSRTEDVQVPAHAQEDELDVLSKATELVEPSLEGTAEHATAKVDPPATIDTAVIEEEATPGNSGGPLLVTPSTDTDLSPTENNTEAEAVDGEEGEQINEHIDKNLLAAAEAEKTNAEEKVEAYSDAEVADLGGAATEEIEVTKTGETETADPNSGQMGKDQFLKCEEAMSNDFEAMTETEMMACAKILNPDFDSLLETEVAAAVPAEKSIPTALSHRNECPATDLQLNWQLMVVVGLTLVAAALLGAFATKKAPPAAKNESSEKTSGGNVILEKDIGAALKQSILKPHLEKSTALQTELDNMTAMLNTQLDDKSEAEKKLQAALADVAEAKSSKTAAIYETEKSHQAVIDQLRKTKIANEMLERELADLKASVADSQDKEVLSNENTRITKEVQVKEEELAAALALVGSLKEDLQTANDNIASQPIFDVAKHEADLQKSESAADEQKTVIAQLEQEVAETKAAWAAGMQTQSKRNAEAFTKRSTELKDQETELAAYVAEVGSLKVLLEEKASEAAKATDDAKKQKEETLSRMDEMGQRLSEATEAAAAQQSHFEEAIARSKKASSDALASRDTQVLELQEQLVESKDQETKLAASVAEVGSLKEQLSVLQSEIDSKPSVDLSVVAKLEADLNKANLLLEEKASEAAKATADAEKQKEETLSRMDEMGQRLSEATEAAAAQQSHFEEAIARSKKELSDALASRDTQVLELQEQLAESKVTIKRSTEEVAAAVSLAATDKESIDSLEASLHETKATWAAQLKEQSKRHAEALAASQGSQLNEALASARSKHDEELRELREAHSEKEDHFKTILEAQCKETSDAASSSKAAASALTEVYDEVQALETRVAVLTKEKGEAQAEADARHAALSKELAAMNEDSAKSVLELAKAQIEAADSKAAKEKTSAELNTLETKFLMLNASRGNSEELKKSLEASQAENSALKEMIDGLHTLTEENAELKQTLQQRALDEEEAKQATETLHEEMMLGLQKTMGTLAEELEETMGKVAEMQAERDAAMGALDLKQDELEEIKAHASAHATEFEESDVANDKIASLEAQLNALNALVEMQEASGGGGAGAAAAPPTPSTEPAADVSASFAASADDGDEGELTMDLNSFLGGDEAGEDPDDW